MCVVTVVFEVEFGQVGVVIANGATRGDIE